MNTIAIKLVCKWIILGCLVGVVVGSTSALLLSVILYLTQQRQSHPWLLFLLPLGGVVIGYFYKKYGKDSDKGNNLIFEHIHGHGQVHLQMGPLVFLGTFLTHLFGGSTGREGAAIQMGGSIAETVNRLFKLELMDRRILLMSGISGGFGSAFGTPLTGAIFGMEVASAGKLSYGALIPCIVSSFVGHWVTVAWGVEHDHFQIKSLPAHNAMTLLKVVAVCLLFGLISVLYMKLRHKIQEITEKYISNYMLRRMLGGVAIIGLVLLIGSRDYTGRGLEMVTQAFEGHVPPLAFLAKLVFTAITLGTGFVGGEAIPLFFVGATLGNTISSFVGMPASFLAALGLIAVFCGAANTPIACFILGLEMFEAKGIEYFFIACIISYIVSGPNGVWPSQKLYEPKSRMFELPSGEALSSIKLRRKDKS